MSGDGRAAAATAVVATLPAGSVEAPARVALEFAADPAGGRTYLRRQYAGYPFHLCRPFYYADDPPGMATVYIQSCSGGVYQEDRLAMAIVAAEGAQAQVTSQASTIVHSMERDEARLRVNLEAGLGAFLEYLPDPMILFPRSRLATSLRVRAHETASVIACDSFLLHDPGASGGVFDRLESELLAESWSGEPLSIDRFEIGGAALAEGLPGVTGRYRAQGSLLVLHRGGGEAATSVAAIVDTLRQALDGVAGIYAGASALPAEAGAWARLLAEDGVALRAGLRAAWGAARRALTGLTPRPRRK